MDDADEGDLDQDVFLCAVPEGSKVAESATLKAARSSTQGCDGAPRGLASAPDVPSRPKRPACQVCPEEPQKPSSGAANGNTLMFAVLRCVK